MHSVLLAEGPDPFGENAVGMYKSPHTVWTKIVIVSTPVHPDGSVPVTMYVVVTFGVAIGVAHVTQDRFVVGVQM